MTHLQKAPRKPLFTDETEAKIFLDLFNDFDEPHYKKIAKLIFVDGLTSAEAGEQIGYSARQVDRIKQQLNRVALLRAIRKLRTRSDTE